MNFFEQSRFRLLLLALFILLGVLSLYRVFVVKYSLDKSIGSSVRITIESAVGGDEISDSIEGRLHLLGESNILNPDGSFKRKEIYVRNTFKEVEDFITQMNFSLAYPDVSIQTFEIIPYQTLNYKTGITIILLLSLITTLVIYILTRATFSRQATVASVIGVLAMTNNSILIGSGIFSVLSQFGYLITTLSLSTMVVMAGVAHFISLMIIARLSERAREREVKDYFEFSTDVIGNFQLDVTKILIVLTVAFIFLEFISEFRSTVLVFLITVWLSFTMHIIFLPYCYRWMISKKPKNLKRRN